MITELLEVGLEDELELEDGRAEELEEVFPLDAVTELTEVLSGSSASSSFDDFPFTKKASFLTSLRISCSVFPEGIPFLVSLGLQGMITEELDKW